MLNLCLLWYELAMSFSVMRAGGNYSTLTN